MPYRIERAFYRIHYPITERPRFWSGTCVYEVLDCCEGGLRYRLSGSEARPAVGATVNGLLRFHRGTELDIEGEVVRVQNGSVALNLTTNRIPFSVILAEQKELLRRYPMID
ncbi:MAG: PilZ domain-containing protein [Gemmatimonadota bacterium]|jgi:hypothetical protein